MKKALFVRFLILVSLVLLATCGIFAQHTASPKPRSQEFSENDGVPVLAKHLPDWENARNSAAYILNPADLRKSLGERPVFDLIDFTGGTEAVTAPYPPGKLLIIEYTTPQASVDADNKIKQRLTEIGQNPPIFYRRVGNYNTFVFDGTDEAAANVLLDQVKYEKDIQWLGTDPFAFKRAERAFVKAAADLFTSTTLAIVGGLGLSVIAGIIVGFVFFFIRNHKRATMVAFSDAGGMTRLNLDGLTPQTLPDRLLED
ncbi:hypothetical protein BH18ACI1_BH18ACI1_14180 [soil metagenome]|nr:hypothetical protein [Acidobacteriota bacterium]